MITKFLIDGMLSGTGVRDGIEGGYVEPSEIGLSASISAELSAWQQEYEGAHFAGFPDERVAELDEQGLALMARVQEELASESIGYFSNGRMKRLA